MLAAFTLPSCNCALDFPEVVPNDGGAPGGGGAPTGGGGSNTTTAGGGGADDTTTTGGNSDGGGGQTGSTLCTVGDEFDGEELDLGCWTQLAEERTMSVTVADGQLTITPTQPMTGWWGEEYGYFLHREIEGAFAVVARVNATANGPITDPPMSVGGHYLMAGLLVRAPNETVGDGETWLKLEMGHRTTADATFSNPVGVLGGLARNGASGQLQVPETTEIGHRGLLGLCRAGNSFLMFSDLDETRAGWVRREDTTGEIGMNVTYPQTMQVGLLTGVYRGAGALRGIFDYVRFAEVNAMEVDEIDECLAVLTDLASGPGENCHCPNP